jgi:hypothetical protein
MKVSTILDQIDLGSIALPEFQRGYVWSGRQVRSFMTSLYKRHPVGSLLVWETHTENAAARGEQDLASGTVKLLLDGQQRITTLYGIIRGNPPEFFDGKASAFQGLHFHLEEEVFEFYAKRKMSSNPLWIDVTELMQEGLGAILQRIMADDEIDGDIQTYTNRLNQIENMKSVDFHIEEVSGADKSIDVVVDIFNKINSGGTKLSKGDLALAKVCGSWPEARDELKVRLEKWADAGYDRFNLDWLLRCITTVLTGEAYYRELEHVSIADFKEGLKRTERVIDTLLNLVASRLGLDFARVLGSRYAFPLMARYASERGMSLNDHRERDKLLYWYVHTFLWGRYAGSTESKLSQDLRAIEEDKGALDRLIQQLRQQRGDLRLRPNDFVGASRGARFYPMMYMLTRVWKARDWGSGVELSNNLLGNQSRLHLHHIFPKRLLYDHDYQRGEVNALANMTFLTQETNLDISDRPPAEYFPEIEERHPGVLESHWIPMDPELWKVENFIRFLDARQDLLADAANRFLDSLLEGALPEAQATGSVLDGTSKAPGGIVDSREEAVLEEAQEWVSEQGFADGEMLYELVDEDDGQVVDVLDLAWPEGLQTGLSAPVALLIDEADETLHAAQRHGFRYFTDVDSFKQYVRKDLLSA